MQKKTGSFMLLNSAKPKVSAREGTRATVSKLILMVCTSVFSMTTMADWQDPLSTPAMKTHLAHKELLLDVTDADQRLVSVGSHGHIIYSDDDGAAWRQASVPVSVTLTSVDFSGANLGWSVGHDGIILNSTDGGESWNKQFDGFLANEAIVSAARDNLEAIEKTAEILTTNGTDLEIDQAMMKLETAQFALQDAEYDLETGSTKPFLDVLFWSETSGIAVGAYGMAFMTRDGGERWFDISSVLPNPNRLHLNSITLVGSQSLVIAGEMGLLLRSDDAGETWLSQESPYDGSLFGLVDHGDDQLLFALRGHVYRSRDDGISWNEIDTGSEQTLLGGFADNRSVMLVGNGGAVLVLNTMFANPKSSIIPGRKASASVIKTDAGHFVVVGESGVNWLSPMGQLLDRDITMIEGAN
jgi:photosystem II stability/assembly factor-like uncharacterized protein